MKIGVLNNLRAGRGRVATERMLHALRSHPEVVHVETSSASVVGEALGELAAAKVELMLLNGGDGTLQHVLTELLADPTPEGPGRWLPLVAPLRGGRTNMAALDLGGSRDPVRGLHRVVDAVRRGRLAERVQRRHVLRLELGDGEAPRYGTFFGAGMLHRAIELTHRTFPTGRAQGVLGGGLVTGLLVGRAALGQIGGVLAPDKMQVALDHEPLEPRENLLAMATTLDRLFLRMRPFWGQEPAPLRVTFIAKGAPGIWAAAPGILRGRPAPRRVPEALGYVSRNVHEAALRLDCGLTLDGELFEPRPGRAVKIGTDPRVRFVRA